MRRVLRSYLYLDVRRLPVRQVNPGTQAASDLG